jgi:hypothetical protein
MKPSMPPVAPVQGPILTGCRTLNNATSTRSRETLLTYSIPGPRHAPRHLRQRTQWWM